MGSVESVSSFQAQTVDTRDPQPSPPVSGSGRDVDAHGSSIAVQGSLVWVRRPVILSVPPRFGGSDSCLPFCAELSRASAPPAGGKSKQLDNKQDGVNGRADPTSDALSVDTSLIPFPKCDQKQGPPPRAQKFLGSETADHAGPGRQRVEGFHIGSQ